jgi:hypothetical protein
MKKPLLVSPFLFLIFLVVLQTQFASCKKETITVTHTDTVFLKDTAISAQLLSANSWKIQELRGVIGNSITSYQRGGTGNTENYDNEYITFNADKTGILFDAAGGTHSLTWDFSNSLNTKLTLIVNNPVPAASQTVVYENLRYKNKALLFDQYWTYNFTNAHTQIIRIPK